SCPSASAVSQAIPQLCHALLYILEDSLIELGIRAIRIFYVPILDFGGVIKSHVAWPAAHIYNDIRCFQYFETNWLRLQSVRVVSISRESLCCQKFHTAERRKSRARGFYDVAAQPRSNSLCHRAAARISQANKQNLRSGNLLHRS